MAFSTREKKKRHVLIAGLLTTHNLRGLLLIGDTAVGKDISGDLRYYTANRGIFYRQTVVVFAESEPVIFAGTPIQTEAAKRRSFVDDCRVISDSVPNDIVKLLRERGVVEGRIGVSMEALPAAWYRYLKSELPGINWVEVHDAILELRANHSDEEIAVYRDCAALGDGAYEAAKAMIKPGISEYEIVAEIEHYARAKGAEEHFTLIASGRFAFGDRNVLPLPYAPSNRRIEPGDTIILEITPRYEGYWTQLVRAVNVGKPNTDMAAIHSVCRGSITKGLENLRQEETIRNVAVAMESHVAHSGYLLKPPLGHICGIDLVEARITTDNSMVFRPGTVAIIHPTIFTPDGKHSYFCGETYLVTSDGYERLNHAGDDLVTVHETT